ncbi:MAG: phosphoribosylanthranilate isomerase [Candidatus Sulfotelmatobacter sp.]
MTWVKICGMTNLEDALVAVEAGADAVGFVFYEKSPRNISIEAAREIVEKLPERVEKVGVFVNEQEYSICTIAEEARLTGVQMHGNDEDPHVADLVVSRLPRLRIFAAVSMRHANPAGCASAWDPDVVSAFLIDSGTPSKLGGTGEAFDWRASVETVNGIKRFGKLALAGGLTAQNVGEAIGILKPWGVDVVSGVETRPGKKDPEKVRAFVKAVRDAESGG